MDSRPLTVLAGACLLVPPFIGTLSSAVPTLYCPMPVLTILPALLGFLPIGLLMPVGLFFLWNPGLLKQQPNMPKRTIALAVVLSTLTIVYFATAWTDGIQYQGVRHTVIMLIINLAWIAFLWFLIVRCWRQPSFMTNLILHWVMFAWLGWYAFPYLGELP